MISRSFCIVTPTYRGDLEPFTQLCRSIDLHMPQTTHYVLVDRSDMAVFAPFSSSRRVIVDCSLELPQFHEFRFLGRRLWWRWPMHVVRGWIYQQLTKIRVVGRLEEDAAVIMDSDAWLIRPIRPEQVFDGDRVRIYRRANDSDGPEFQKWHNVALASYGLPQTGYTGYSYISTAVIWAPEVVRAMSAEIERATGRKWHDELIRPFRFSEYIQYGVFCDRIAGPHRDLVSPVPEEICHCSWHYDLDTDQGVDSFLDDLQEWHSAVLIQSNLRLSEERRLEIVKRFEGRFGCNGKPGAALPSPANAAD